MIVISLGKFRRNIENACMIFGMLILFGFNWELPMLIETLGCYSHSSRHVSNIFKHYKYIPASRPKFGIAIFITAFKSRNGRPSGHLFSALEWPIPIPCRWFPPSRCPTNRRWHQRIPRTSRPWSLVAAALPSGQRIPAEKKILKHRKWLRENVQLFPTVSSSNTNLLAGLVMAKLCFVKCPIVPGLSFELHLHQEWFGIGSFCELFRSRRLTGSWVPGGMGWAKKMFNLVITDRKFIFRISLWMAYWYQYTGDVTRWSKEYQKIWSFIDDVPYVPWFSPGNIDFSIHW